MSTRLAHRSRSLASATRPSSSNSHTQQVRSWWLNATAAHSTNSAAAYRHHTTTTTTTTKHTASHTSHTRTFASQAGRGNTQQLQQVVQSPYPLPNVNNPNPKLLGTHQTPDTIKYWKSSGKPKRLPTQHSQPVYEYKLTDDDPTDRSYRITCSMIVERLPTVQTEMHPMDKVYFEYTEARKQFTHLPLPPELVDSPTMLAEDEVPQEEVPIETQDDRRNNVKSLNRRLQQSLYLLVRYRRSGSKQNQPSEWQFPTLAWGGNWQRQSEQQTLRQVAESAAHTDMGFDFSIHPLGNAPIGVYKYKYPKPQTLLSQFDTKKDQQYTGVKQYLFHSIYQGNHRWQPSELSADIEEYMWVPKAEVQKYVKPELWQVVDDCLIDIE